MLFRTAFLLLVFIMAFSAPLSAQERGDSTPPRAALLGLARAFVDRIGDGLRQADRDIATYARSPRKENRLPPVDIPDGETLLLYPRLGKLSVEKEVMAVKEGDDVFVSLTDFFRAADFAVETDPAAGTARGWFIREDKKFTLDLNTGVVEAAEQKFSIAPDDVRRGETDILVASTALGEWIGADIWPNFAQQFLEVESAVRWPVEERLARRNRPGLRLRDRPPPSLPRQEQEYQQTSVPNVDVSLSHNYSRRNAGDGATQTTTRRTGYGIQASGDMAQHTAKLFAGGNTDNELAHLRLNMSRDSEEPDLLGALRARKYEFGDINTTRLPLTGQSFQEFGARITNRSQEDSIHADKTGFSGTAPPGWDVELYRNDILLGFRTVGEDGFYLFDNIPLFTGENKFRVLFYGLQGEIREELRSVFVDPESPQMREGIYDVSASLNNEQTYRNPNFEDPDKGSPHITASYEKTFSQDLSVSAGLRSRQEEEKEKLYLQGGVATTIMNTLYNINAAYDVDGEFALEALGRRSFGKHDFRSSMYLATDNFNPDGTQNDPPVFASLAEMQGPLPDLAGLKMNYSVSSDYRLSASGADSTRTRGSVSTRIGKMSLNKSASFLHSTDADGDTEDTLSGAASARGGLLGIMWRGGATYEAMPESEFRSLFLDASRKIAKDLMARFEVSHELVPSITEGRASLIWTGEHVTIAPSIRMDTEDQLQAALNVRFGLSQDPRDGSLAVSGKSLSGKGGVSALVYLDRNGDRVFSEGDDLLKDVKVEAVHSGKKSFSGDDGIAFLYDLPVNRVTDVELDENTLEDPFWIPGFEGISVRPRAGMVTEVDFPVHISGEVDGTVYIEGSSGGRHPAGNLRLYLYDMDGKLSQASAASYDGFYLFSRIPPGRYMILFDNADMKRLRAARPDDPPVIEIGYDGTILYGRDIILTTDADVPLSVADLKTYEERHPHVDLDSAVNGGGFVLNLGSYNSRLMMALVWYRLNARYAAIIGGAELLVQPSESFESARTGKHILRASLPAAADMKDAMRRCRALIARDLSCAVEMVPNASEKQAAAGNGRGKG